MWIKVDNEIDGLIIICGSGFFLFFILGVMGGASIWDYESYASLGRVHGEREREKKKKKKKKKKKM